MERLVLVHGSVSNGPATWGAQRPLADRFELVVLNRPGFPPGPPVERVDFEEHAEWVAAALRPGDHLCGHSYGGVVSLLAAAAAPELRSLTVIEPPAPTVRPRSSGRRRLRGRSDRALAGRAARAGGVPAHLLARGRLVVSATVA